MNTHDVYMMFAEANLLTNLNHKNIVKVKEAFTFNDLTATFIMEYLPGVNYKFLGRPVIIYQLITRTKAQ